MSTGSHYQYHLRLRTLVLFRSLQFKAPRGTATVTDKRVAYHKARDLIDPSLNIIKKVPDQV